MQRLHTRALTYCWRIPHSAWKVTISWDRHFNPLTGNRAWKRSVILHSNAKCTSKPKVQLPRKCKMALHFQELWESNGKTSPAVINSLATITFGISCIARGGSQSWGLPKFNFSFVSIQWLQDIRRQLIMKVNSVSPQRHRSTGVWEFKPTSAWLEHFFQTNPITVPFMHCQLPRIGSQPLSKILYMPVWFSLTKTKMVKNEKTTNSLTKTKTKTKKYKTIENEKIENENENAKTAKLVTQRKC